ncbi:MAG: hypothetical protein JSV43_06685 [Methanobacteriota archaeon]|nr:MAG: hypothetical protein JSV43_06685 [Euryarchaeota archaeon]
MKEGRNEQRQKGERTLEGEYPKKEENSGLEKGKNIERKKYLLNVMLDVDVDEIAAKVAAQYFFRQAVAHSERIHPFSAQWRQSLKRAGGIVFLPRRVLQVGAEETAQ